MFNPWSFIAEYIAAKRVQQWLSSIFADVTPRFLREDVAVPPEGFVIRYVKRCAVGPDPASTVCHDTLEAFVLYRGKRALAAIGFKRLGDTLVIPQIQATADALKSLSAFRWERMLLAVAVAWAERSGCNAVLVLKGAKNPWVGQKLENAERFKMRYDVTARRSGFRELDENYYIKRLIPGTDVAPGAVPAFSRDWFRPRMLNLYAA